jgi:hypothetical protein
LSRRCVPLQPPCGRIQDKVIHLTGYQNLRIFLCTAWFDQRSNFRP